ncbi:hypothetical protein, partial [Porphyromonas endodontalis]|uniref:hypothetical protein n=1 Tax=Porphyromonas endodontalis TaxID=28124 RepID=UPI0026ED4F12
EGENGTKNKLRELYPNPLDPSLLLRNSPQERSFILSQIVKRKISTKKSLIIYEKFVHCAR